ncbi:MAG: iron-containing alcohol dehydrogenase [Selenomonas sp.]|uniref:iron-containing alcohol dehydrogenase n=1 Tax=Selenomonas sp. TaxID=2053611 RepID=UPI0025CE3C00|nr:iron-containing alcohol dehydrogenase [Selenomonas sp.]MCR5757377.1 iron-containing alcohol dehydrogenase [Selenomonas sp.]
MQAFNFKVPTEIVFGRDAEEKVAEKLSAYNAHRVFITYGGGSVVKSGLLGKIEKSLQSAGLFTQAKGGVQPNPRLSWVREAIKEALAFQADFILAIGGGSVIDSAKAVAHGTANPEIDVWSFWSGTATLTKSLPVGTVLTLAAAGSETSDSAVITNEETGKKAGLNTPFNRPALAFMNPELTFTVPKKQLICGISDILMHTLERYFTNVKEENALTDRIAESLLKTVIACSFRAIKDQTDYDAMSEIMYAGTISHCGLTELGRCKDFACHKLGHELSGRFDVTHGASLTAIWGSWAEYVYRDDIPRFAQFAEKVWNITSGTEEERAQAGIAKTVAYFKEIQMPTNFTELGIGVQKEDVLVQLADSCTAGGTKVVANFHPIDKATAIEIYRLANK